MGHIAKTRRDITIVSS